MNQAISDLMAQADATLTRIENNIALDLNLSETKDEIIARQAALIKSLEKQLRDIVENL